MMHRDVLGLAQPLDVRERKLDWILDQSTDLQLELPEAVIC
jgi:hypothetical protein